MHIIFSICTKWRIDKIDKLKQNVSKNLNSRFDKSKYLVVPQDGHGILNGRNM